MPGNTCRRRHGRNYQEDPMQLLNTVETLVSRFHEEIHSHSPSTQLLLISMFAQGVRQELFRVRSCAAAIDCAKRLHGVTDSVIRAAATSQFFDAFSQLWAESCARPDEL